MRFFGPNKNQSDNSQQISSRTTENTGLSDQVDDTITFNSDQNNGFGGSNFNSLIDHFNTEKEIAETNPNLENRNKSRNETESDPDPEDPDNENPTQDEDPGKVKASHDMLVKQGQAIANTENYLIPKGIALLNGEKGVDENNIPKENKYKADKKAVEILADAWTTWLEHKEYNYTPGQQLVIAHLMAFGLPVGGAVLNFWQRKKHEREMERLRMIQAIQNQNNPQPGPQPDPGPQQPDPGPQQPTPESEASPEKVEQSEQPDPGPQKTFFTRQQPDPIEDPDPDPVEDPDPDPVEDPGNNDGKFWKLCKNEGCEKSFETGTGFARTKGSKNFDCYCSKDCMYNDLNTKAYQSTQRAKEKKKKNNE